MPKVNKDLCLGCGACASLAPNTFIMEADGKAGVKSEGPYDEQQVIEEAANSCPVQAIQLNS